MWAGKIAKRQIPGLRSSLKLEIVDKAGKFNSKSNIFFEQSFLTKFFQV